MIPTLPKKVEIKRAFEVVVVDDLANQAERPFVANEGLQNEIAKLLPFDMQSAYWKDVMGYHMEIEKYKKLILGMKMGQIPESLREFIQVKSKEEKI